MKPTINIFWHRRDIRLHDNAGLYHALKSNKPVLPIFIFDRNILDKLEDKYDARVTFIHNSLQNLNKQLAEIDSAIEVKYGFPLAIWQELIKTYNIEKVFTNHDYEPYALERDKSIAELLQTNGIEFITFKDHVFFEKDEIIKDDGLPYTVFTPYSRKWKAKLKPYYFKSYPTEKYFSIFYKHPSTSFPSLEEMGFNESPLTIPLNTVSNELIKKYSEQRNFPSINGTSRLGIHLRFGTISIRQLAKTAYSLNETFFNELIWRDFYQMILWHFPHSASQAFKKDYNKLKWLNNETHFQKWCEGKTGYPIVDAGMRELNATGFMHNRVRMITASFLTKHLLIDWRWGEAFFAKKLLDFDLASNNGGWQWAASTGCDAAPYFRIFSPSEQTKKFDQALTYIRKWVPELDTFDYPQPIVEHTFARDRAINFYKNGLAK